MKKVDYNTSYKAGFKALYRKIWTDEPYGELFSDEDIENQEIIILGVDADDEVIGFIAGYSFKRYSKKQDIAEVITGDHIFYFSEWGVAVECRRQKHGQELYKEFEDLVVSRGFDKILLRTSPADTNPAMGYYLDQDFVQIEGAVSQVEQRRVDDRPAIDSRIYMIKDVSSATKTFKPGYNYDDLVTRFKRKHNIKAIIGISGGADNVVQGLEKEDPLQKKIREATVEYHTKILYDFLVLLKNYGVAVLTGGTVGGIPELATRIAKNLGFRTIGVFPARGRKDALPGSLVDLSICVHPMISGSQWGDEAPVWTSLIDGVIVIAGKSGTLIEYAHLLKINESRVSRSERPKYIVPISKTGGTSEHVYFLCSNPEVKYKVMPHFTVVNGTEAAKYLLNALCLSDYFDYQNN